MCSMSMLVGKSVDEAVAVAVEDLACTGFYN